MAVGGQHHTPAALPLGRHPVSNIQEAGWAPEPVWMDKENFAPTGIHTCTGCAMPAHLVGIEHYLQL